MRSVPVSTSEFILISDIKKKIIPVGEFEPVPLSMVTEHYNAKPQCRRMSDIGYRIKLYSDIRYNVGLCSLSPISKIRYQAQSDIADPGYRKSAYQCVHSTYLKMCKGLLTFFSEILRFLGLVCLVTQTRISHAAARLSQVKGLMDPPSYVPDMS
jgi:hypothetical protein